MTLGQWYQRLCKKQTGKSTRPGSIYAALGFHLCCCVIRILGAVWQEHFLFIKQCFLGHAEDSYKNVFGHTK